MNPHSLSPNSVKAEPTDEDDMAVDQFTATSASNKSRIASSSSASKQEDSKKAGLKVEIEGDDWEEGAAKIEDIFAVDEEVRVCLCFSA
jgi:hypothetical protein